RFPSWLYLAAAAGQNLPLLTVKLACDMAVRPLTSYQVGKLFVRTVSDALLDVRQFMELTVSGEVRL
ncbi:MAG TPA: hypothetical protein P5208_11275, partial [Smithellaceae bacterium]|nr:hypothetical protein [Smithellaceae bacterium]